VLCASKAKKCATSVAVHCDCIKEQLQCIKNAGTCDEAAASTEEAKFTCFTLGCDYDCSRSFGSGGCNLAVNGLTCPNDRAACLNNLDLSAPQAKKCECENKYFQCVGQAHACPGYPAAFMAKSDACSKVCKADQCDLPASASTNAIAPIAIAIVISLVFA
jgi:hypothetical protein